MYKFKLYLKTNTVKSSIIRKNIKINILINDLIDDLINFIKSTPTLEESIVLDKRGNGTPYS